MKRSRLSVSCTLALALLALAAACGGGEQKRLTPEELARCGARGAPVTVAKLVKVLRSNGITADLNERKCEEPLVSAVAQVTNGGYDGLQPQGEVVVVEGNVLCSLEGGVAAELWRSTSTQTTKRRMCVLST